MPSAHGPIFCPRKSRSGGPIFSRLSQRRRPIFCRKQLREKIGPTFSRTKNQRTLTDFLSELLCVTIAGEVPLLDDVTPIFYRTEVSAHGPIFCRKQFLGAIFYRSKSQRTRTDFHSVCAGHKNMFKISLFLVTLNKILKINIALLGNSVVDYYISVNY